MNDTYELTWKRNPETSDYNATDERDDTRYTVAKYQDTRGTSWMLAALPPGNFPVQARTGFSRLNLAQAAALSTRCARCYRHRPFGTLEETGRNNVWTCRDRAECEAIEAARDDELTRHIRESRNQDWAGVEFREDKYGPELAIDQDGRNVTVVSCTERDVLTLAVTALDWLRARWAAELDEARKASGS